MCSQLPIAPEVQALALLRRGLLDVAVIEGHGMPTGHADDDLLYLPLLTDPFRLVLPRRHHLATRPCISLDALSAETWIDLRCEVDCRRAPIAAFFGGWCARIRSR